MTLARAVVFDFDGVLADTEGLHLASFQHVFSARGWTLEREAYFAGYLGCTDHDLVWQYALEQDLTMSEADVEAIVREKGREYERRIASGQVLYPGTSALIGRLGRRFRLAIASGSFRTEIASILSANDLASLISAVVGAEDVEHSKPAPDPYATAVGLLGVAPSAAVAIEDSVPGLVSARAAGLRTIGITTSHPAADLHSADIVVDTLDAITVELVDSLLS